MQLSGVISISSVTSSVEGEKRDGEKFTWPRVKQVHGGSIQDYNNILQTCKK